MKKLLLSFVLLPMIGFAQQAHLGTPVRAKNAALMTQKTKKEIVTDHAAPVAAVKPAASHAQTKSTNPGTVVGETYYDLQTNSATYRRVANYGTSQSVIWTFAPSSSDNTYAQRGTGYNSNAGGAWGAIPSARIEQQRTGFPNILPFANNEGVLCHTATPGYNDYLTKNSAIGSSSFTGAATTPLNLTGNIWPRAAAAGSNIYFVDCSQDTNSRKAGVKQPVLYSRSTNGGTTWVDDHITLPGYDSTIFYRNGGDNYFVDAKDSIVAIVIGGYGNSVVLWKSMDYGVNFTRTIVDSFPVLGYNTSSTAIIDQNNDLIADTFLFNTGSVSALIDNNGNVNIWWSTINGLNDGGGLSYYPASQSTLEFWSEATGTKTTIDNFYTAIHDCDGDGAINIGANYFTSATDDGDAYYPGEGMITQPQAGIDAAGNLFVFYSSVMENDTTVAGVASVASQNFRDILGAFSTDGGATWSLPINVSQSWGVEDAFPTVARDVDNNIHLSWQADAEPGTALQNADPIAVNQIMYLALDKATFMTKGTSLADACNSTAVPMPPVASFTYTIDANDQCTVHFTDASTGNPANWTWVFGDGNTSTAQNPSHTYTTPATRNVQLVVGNVYGNNSSPITKIGVCFAAGVASIDAANAVSVYPNPATSEITVNMEGINAAQSVVTIENAIGQTVMTVDNKNAFSKLNVNVASLENGIYFVKVKSSNGVATKRFVKE
ncbi:MAG: hypothetical protein RL138_283 [Bacteroidota bacterium]|jgi:PKD repeat protein